VGREFIEYLARSWGFPKTKKGLSYFDSPPDHFGEGSGVVKVGYLDSYMNQSGVPLAKAMYAEGIKPERLLVVVDDFMIPLGTVRVRPSGSSGGHNGLKSVAENLQTEEFGRLRIGIGPVPAPKDPADFVLERFPSSELDLIDKVFAEIEKALSTLCVSGYDKGMNALNKKFF
jgi:PTH1 family peptidyl-tRNA hydrolase